MTKNYDEYTRKLLYMSNYRGCKESEIIFGRFVQKHLENLSDEQKKQYENILEYPDSILMDWLIFNKDVPEKIKNSDIFNLLQTCLMK